MHCEPDGHDTPTRVCPGPPVASRATGEDHDNVLARAPAAPRFNTTANMHTKAAKPTAQRKTPTAPTRPIANHQTPPQRKGCDELSTAPGARRLEVRASCARRAAIYDETDDQSPNRAKSADQQSETAGSQPTRPTGPAPLLRRSRRPEPAVARRRVEPFEAGVLMRPILVSVVSASWPRIRCGR